MADIQRRNFLKITATLSLLPFSSWAETIGKTLTPLPGIKNPLAKYPHRDWEKMYRQLYEPDDHFIFGCQPNDTHNCLLKADVKNDVISFIGPSFGYGKAQDVYGNKASARWDPRICPRGVVVGRRIYGDRRVKGAYVRSGFKKWAEDGYPRNDDGSVPGRYLNRGKESFIRIPFEEAYELTARTLLDTVKTYQGSEGAEKLLNQGYDPEMVSKMNEAGTQVLKFRGGMPLLGVLRIFGMYRVANMMSLVDSNLRNVGPDNALGGRGWDNYSWHTDLPPGHTMVTGQQTIDYDLVNAEYSNLIICWGMNWITTKMPDGHWLAEARAKGTKVVTVACEYQSTSNKADEVILIRPGSDPAFALGLANVIINEKLYDTEYVKSFTDLPLLVRTDTMELLRAKDVIEVYEQKNPTHGIKVLRDDEEVPPMTEQGTQLIRESLVREWHDPMVFDSNTQKVRPLSRDEVGSNFKGLNIDPALEGRYRVTLLDGTEVEVRPSFDMVKEYLKAFDPETVAKICWVSKKAVTSLALDIAKNRGKTLITTGMGPNHFFNNDLKDRDILLVGALTGNIGKFGGNVGSYAGNYRGAYYNGIGQWIGEDMFDLEKDPDIPARVKSRYKMESAHYYNYGDRPLRLGNKMFTGNSHMPTPTKMMWTANSNSILGNSKWFYDVVMNTLPKIDMIVTQEWWWTATCEYSDIIFGVDSWAEAKYPDLSAAVTNPFVHPITPTPMPKIHDTYADVEIYAGVAKALGEILGDNRFRDAWKFVHEKTAENYLQRIIDASSTMKGYRIEKLMEDGKKGIPAILMTRTYPKYMGYEQTVEGKPWYTKSGRLEFYRDEPEFIEHGENLPVHREPVDGTVFEPNVIVAGSSELIRPRSPEDYGLSRDDRSTESNQVRNVIMTPQELLKSKHPNFRDGYQFIYITPKTRHASHTTPIDTDYMAMWSGPFTDIYRTDKRMPFVAEGYIDIHPGMAKELGLEDGDYVYVEADPGDRPYRNWKEGTEDHKVSNLVLRVRYYPGTLPHVTRSFFHMYTATHGSVEGHEKRKDGLAKNPRTGYQAMYRYGGHQSATRAWLRPTLQTESLARKNYAGQMIGKGFEADVHCVVGAPKESFIRLRKKEDGGIGGKGLWRPARLGFRFGYENDAMKLYLVGGYVKST